MRIAVYGGSGMVGSRIVVEALSRDHRVTALTRAHSEGVPSGATPRQGDAADEDDVARIAAEHDVVVSAIGPSRTGVRHKVFLDTLAVLCENVGTRRLLIVGSSGSLELSPGLRLMDRKGFPEAALPEARTHYAALEQLRDTGALVDWLYLSPGGTMAAGTRTGAYRIGGDTPIGDEVSAEDFALAVVDEIELPRFRRARINIAH